MSWHVDETGLLTRRQGRGAVGRPSLRAGGHQPSRPWLLVAIILLVILALLVSCRSKASLHTSQSTTSQTTLSQQALFLEILDTIGLSSDFVMSRNYSGQYDTVSTFSLPYRVPTATSGRTKTSPAITRHTIVRATTADTVQSGSTTQESRHESSAAALSNKYAPTTNNELHSQSFYRHSFIIVVLVIVLIIVNQLAKRGNNSG